MAADGLVNRGNTFKEIGRVNEAIQDYAQAIAIRPTMAEAHANLASAYKDRYFYYSYVESTYLPYLDTFFFVNIYVNLGF